MTEMNRARFKVSIQAMITIIALGIDSMGIQTLKAHRHIVGVAEGVFTTYQVIADYKAIQKKPLLSSSAKS